MATTLEVQETAEVTPSAQQVTPLDALFAAYDEGYAAAFLNGRSLYDLVVAEDGRVLTLFEHLRRRGRSQYGMLTLTYSLARGLDWDAPRLEDDRDRTTVDTALRTHGLLGIPQDENEMTRVLRGIAALARTSADGLKWADGTPMRFLILLEFAEHLTPTGDNVGRTDQEIRAVELAHVLGQSNALRQSGNFVVFHGRAGLVDDLVEGALHSVCLAQPDVEEKRRFLTAAQALYPGIQWEQGLGEEHVARLTASTPNRGLEARLRAAYRSGETLTVEDLLVQKSKDVVALSEQTLTLLDTRRVAGIRLVGRAIEWPLRLLVAFGEGLLHGNVHIPANVVLVGPPGTGKTDLALFAAARARTSAYQIHSPKGGIVGETERKARLLTTALSEWTPNVAFVDEITEALPLERSDFDGDSGATRAVTAALLTALSDESRRGRSLLVATTNCPWRMGAAMRSRFTMIPVLSPVRPDYPAIIRSIAERVQPGVTLEAEIVEAAAEQFYAKGASPREILGEVSIAMLDANELSGDVVLQASRDVSPVADRASIEYADLWAIRACTSQRYLPWHDHPDQFPYPPHLENLVDPDTGSVDSAALERRIETLRSHANV